MDDLISRQAAIDAVIKETYMDGAYGYSDAKSLVDAICDLPSAQPDIIVCAGCKYWICHDKRCGYWNHGAKSLEWCCHAERRTDEQSD